MKSSIVSNTHLLEEELNFYLSFAQHITFVPCNKITTVLELLL